MPSGKTHDTINLLALPVFLIVSIWVGMESIPYSFLFAIGYVFATFLCGPDLDTYSNLYRRWGVFRFIWTPYRKVFPHRSLFTHGVLVGDAIRVMYLFGWAYILCILPRDLVVLISEFFPLLISTLVGAGFLVITILICYWLLRDRIKQQLNFRKQPFGIFWSLILGALLLYNLIPSTGMESALRSIYASDASLFVYFFSGMVVSSFVHSLSDVLVTAVKRHPMESVFLISLILCGTILFLHP